MVVGTSVIGFLNGCFPFFLFGLHVFIIVFFLCYVKRVRAVTFVDAVCASCLLGHSTAASTACTISFL